MVTEQKVETTIRKDQIIRVSDIRKIVIDELKNELPTYVNNYLTSIPVSPEVENSMGSNSPASNSNNNNANNNINNGKKKRAPTKWNLFLKDCVPTLEKELPMGDKVKACSVQYKQKKNSLVIGEDGKLHDSR